MNKMHATATTHQGTSQISVNAVTSQNRIAPTGSGRGQHRKWLCNLLFMGFLVVFIAQTNNALAAKEDFSQAIDVSADRSEYNEKTGVQALSGNVEIRQGSLLIKAEKISVKLEDNKLSIIEGTGKPIRFQQENDQGELVTATCDSIIYEAAKGVLTLLGNASLKQPKQELKSDKIVFNSIDQSVIAEGGKSGRVNITIQPPTQTQ